MRARGDAIAPSQLVFVLQPAIARPQSECDNMSKDGEHKPAWKQECVLLSPLPPKQTLLSSFSESGQHASAVNCDSFNEQRLCIGV